MAVLHPLKVVIENYPEGEVEELEAVNNPEDPNAGTRVVPFSRELWIEQEDFREVPPKKYFRLPPGQEVRLRWAYIVKCMSVVEDERVAVTGRTASRPLNPSKQILGRDKSLQNIAQLCASWRGRRINHHRAGECSSC